MEPNWAYALDMCAAAGILNYDAPADILGQKPRYIGAPRENEIPTKLLEENIKIKKSPDIDEFQIQDENATSNPKWKKILFGVLAAGAIIGTTLSILVKKGKIKLPKIKMPKFKLPKFFHKP